MVKVEEVYPIVITVSGDAQQKEKKFRWAIHFPPDRLDNGVMVHKLNPLPSLHEAVEAAERVAEKNDMVCGKTVQVVGVNGESKLMKRENITADNAPKSKDKN